MKTTEKQNQLRVVFISYEQQSCPDYLINLLNRHPDICVFDGSDFLIDKLLQFPHASFGSRSSVFFDLVFDLACDERFKTSNFTLQECEQIGESKNCYEAFLKLMNFYKTRTKPSATTVVYKFRAAMDFKSLFNNLIAKDLHVKYIHLLEDSSLDHATEESNSNTVLSSIFYGVLQLKQQDFIRNYEYEYKRLFSFLNAATLTEKPGKKERKLYSKKRKLTNVQNSWYEQVVSKNEKLHEEVLVEKMFKD